MCERFDDAKRDLAEAELIAERGSMLIWQIDAAIERCRLHLAMGDRDSARECLERAKALIKETEKPYVPYVSDWAEWDPPAYIGTIKPGDIVGYHRRDWEIEEIELRVF